MFQTLCFFLFILFFYSYKYCIPLLYFKIVTKVKNKLCYDANDVSDIQPVINIPKIKMNDFQICDRNSTK